MRTKPHDQRKGQWLINKIREQFNYKDIKSVDQEKRMIELRLWNMENVIFDKIMSDYNE